MGKIRLLLRKSFNSGEKVVVKSALYLLLVCMIVLGMSGSYLSIPISGVAYAADGDDPGTDPGSGGDAGSGDTSGDPGDSGDSGGDGPDDSGNDNGDDERDADSEGNDRSDDADDEDTDDPDNDINDGMDNPMAIAATPYGELDGLGKSKSTEWLLQKLEALGELTPVQSGDSKSSNGENSSPTDELLLMPTPLPSYAIGDAFIYSDGSWERVNDINSETITWSNHQGNYSSGSVDFTYKRAEWETSRSMGERSFKPTEFLFDEPTGSLWPLGIGNKTRFDEKGRWIGVDGLERVYDSYWRCDVEAAEKIQVVAGEFDTWRIGCARYADSYSYPKYRAREYRTWYYAPEIQHWVLEIQEKRGAEAERRKELVAIVPDLSILTAEADDSRQVQEQFQEVLESNEDGEMDLWMTASGRLTISMTAQDRYVAADNISCRKYEQQIQAGELHKSYLGIACRSADGMWSIPRL